ncbi:unnamed protein product [Phaedon cochleariae]|uniref:Methyltransferase-like protein 22 n=1 Tax=Phaedon cochleariae TaxID=80249 RepID=A0A9P0DVH8_PHACE|nr:unnamed protein product [Phaedon cochleariae]
MENDDYEVSSEIFEEGNYVTSTSTEPKIHSSYVVSTFNFLRPQIEVFVDSDGDLNVPRRKSEPVSDSVEIEHMRNTVLKMVGLQIWRGAFLVADWLIANHHTIPKGSYILELGSGTGLTGIVASMFFPVICTDVDRGDILGLIRSNVKRNSNLCRHPVEVVELDFMTTDLPPEVERHLSEISVVIAADTVYDDSITEGFVKTVQCLLSRPPTRSVYIALEKRYVFTVADLESVAPCFEFFLECLGNLENVTCQELQLDFPKYFEYDRVKELVMWKVTSNFE